MRHAGVNEMSHPSDTHAALKRWLRNRFTEGERPKEEWRRAFGASWEHLLGTRVRDLIDADAANDLVLRLADPELITELFRPVVESVVRAAIFELAQDEEPLEHFVPSEAQQRLRLILAKPGLVHPDWIRNTFRGEAAEAVVSDAVYRALMDFSTLLPRLMVRISPLGRWGVVGGAGVMMARLIKELERLIEPEIRAFVAEGTERILSRAAEFTIARIDDPASIEFRTSLAAFILAKSPAFYLQPVDEELIAEIGDYAEETARHIVQMPEIRERAHAWVEGALDRAADETLAELLQISSTGPRLPMGAMADTSWPAFKTMINSPAVVRWMDQILDELLEEYERAHR